MQGSAKLFACVNVSSQGKSFKFSISRDSSDVKYVRPPLLSMILCLLFRILSDGPVFARD